MTQGLEDCERRVLRNINSLHDTFHPDDTTRYVRLLRFAQTLGMTVHPSLQEYVGLHGRADVLGAENYWAVKNEMRKMLVLNRDFPGCVKALLESGYLKHQSPTLDCEAIDLGTAT